MEIFKGQEVMKFQSIIFTDKFKFENNKRYFDPKFLGHVGATLYVYDRAHRSVEDTFGYKNIVLLQMDGPQCKMGVFQIV